MSCFAGADRQQVADSQISGTLRGLASRQGDRQEKRCGSISPRLTTFDQELSPLVFPLYVTSKAYHSNGDMSQKLRPLPCPSARRRPISGCQPPGQQFITLEAARKDPLAGLSVYDRIEIRNVPETGTRMSQFRTGQQDIISGRPPPAISSASKECRCGP